MASPTSEPTSVVAFQSTKTPAPVTQKPSRAATVSGCATLTAVDSSIVNWAAKTFRSPRTSSIRATCSPYRPLRTPRSVEVAMAAGPPAAPAAMTPTNANCEPPENSSSDSTCVWRIDRPAATDRAPKLTP